VTTTGDQTILVRTKPMASRQGSDRGLAARHLWPFEELRYELVGPAVGAEVTRTHHRVAVAALFILLLSSLPFRKGPNAFRMASAPSLP